MNDLLTNKFKRKSLINNINISLNNEKIDANLNKTLVQSTPINISPLHPSILKY